MKFETMEDLFLCEIQDLYDAEQRLVKALPIMAEAAASAELRQAFEKHLADRVGHVGRLEQIFAQMGRDAKATTCDAMKGLVKEGIEESPLRDAGLIAASNRVEHYEIAAYGSARTFAQTLQEEKMADEKLTEIVLGMVNDEALRVGNMQPR